MRNARRALLPAFLLLVVAAAPAHYVCAETGDAPTIKLVSAGSEPKTKLRLTAKPGMRRTMTMTMNMAMEMSVKGAAVPSPKMPTTVIPLDLEVTDVKDNGDIHYNFTFGEAQVTAGPDVPKQMVESMKKANAGLKGTTGSAVLTAGGFTKSAQIKLPPNADAQARQMMDNLKRSLEQASTPLPEEPVGKGAKWEVTWRIEQGEIAMTQTVVNELTAIDGDRITMAVQLRQTADPQAGEPTAESPKLQSMITNATGETVMELDGLVPTSSDMSMKTESKMLVLAQGQKTEMGMKIDLSMKMAAK